MAYSCEKIPRTIVCWMMNIWYLIRMQKVPSIGNRPLHGDDDDYYSSIDDSKPQIIVPMLIRIIAR